MRKKPVPEPPAPKPVAELNPEHFSLGTAIKKWQTNSSVGLAVVVIFTAGALWFKVDAISESNKKQDDRITWLDTAAANHRTIIYGKVIPAIAEGRRIDTIVFVTPERRRKLYPGHRPFTQEPYDYE